jgi:hypothetical protein
LSEQGLEGSNPDIHFTQSGVVVVVVVVMALAMAMAMRMRVRMIMGWAAQGRLPGWTRSLEAIIAPLTIGDWLQKSVQDRF